MPIYVYKCDTCGQRFELMQSMSADPLSRCSEATCVRLDGEARGGGEVARVLFAPAIHFKGTGFHNTDYGTRRRGSDTGESSDKGADKGAATSGDGAPATGKSGAGEGGASSATSSKTVGLDKV